LFDLSFLAPDFSAPPRAFSTTNHPATSFAVANRAPSRQRKRERLTRVIGDRICDASAKRFTDPSSQKRRCLPISDEARSREPPSSWFHVGLTTNRDRLREQIDVEPMERHAFWICNQEPGTAV